MAGRAFRTDRSLEAEMVTRKMIPELCASRGFRDVRNDNKHFGTSISQTIHATSPNGQHISIRVKLGRCPQDGKIKYSASQLIAKIHTGDWEGEIQSFIDRARQEGVIFRIGQSALYASVRRGSQD